MTLEEIDNILYKKDGALLEAYNQLRRKAESLEIRLAHVIEMGLHKDKIYSELLHKAKKTRDENEEGTNKTIYQ